jgi:hypothetical protein
VLAACLGAPAQAAAATTVTITPSADPVEDTTYQLTFAGNSDSTRYLWAHIKPAGGQPCGPTRAADNEGSTLVDGYTAQGSYSKTINVTTRDSGDYLVCAWVQSSSGSTTPDAAATKTVTVRPPHSTASVQVPSSVPAGSTFQIGIVAQTEVGRSLFVDLNAPGVPCAANYSANSGYLTVLDDEFNQGGPTTYTRNITAPKPDGAWTVCGWVQEGSGDTVPEATFGAALQVTPSAACLHALAGADRASRSAATHRSLAAKYRKKAKRSRGRAHKNYLKKARRQSRLYSSAQNSATNWNNRVASECG